jgi:hypothetical protein
MNTLRNTTAWDHELKRLLLSFSKLNAISSIWASSTRRRSELLASASGGRSKPPKKVAAAGDSGLERLLESYLRGSFDWSTQVGELVLAESPPPPRLDEQEVVALCRGRADQLAHAARHRGAPRLQHRHLPGWTSRMSVALCRGRADLLTHAACHRGGAGLDKVGAKPGGLARGGASSARGGGSGARRAAQPPWPPMSPPRSPTPLDKKLSQRTKPPRRRRAHRGGSGARRAASSAAMGSTTPPRSPAPLDEQPSQWSKPPRRLHAHVDDGVAG